MGPFPISLSISVYNVVGRDQRCDHYHSVCVCVWYNVVGKDPRWDHYHFLCALVCISVVYVYDIMLLVRTQDGDRYQSLCVWISVYICSVCVLYNVIGNGPI